MLCAMSLYSGRACDQHFEGLLRGVDDELRILRKGEEQVASVHGSYALNGIHGFQSYAIATRVLLGIRRLSTKEVAPFQECATRLGRICIVLAGDHANLPD